MDSSSTFCSNDWWTGITLWACLMCFSKLSILLKIFAHIWHMKPAKFGTCLDFICDTTLSRSLEEYLEPEQARHMNRLRSRDILVSISKSHLFTTSVSLLSNVPGLEGELGKTELIWISSLIRTLLLDLFLKPKTGVSALITYPPILQVTLCCRISSSKLLIS